MFSHVFLYRLKILSRDRTMVFWTLIFPFLLSTIFHLVFSGFSGSVRFSPVPVAVVDNDAYRNAPGFHQVLSQVSTGDGRILDLVGLTDEETAALWLKQKKIRGYILFLDTIQWHVGGSGLSESLVKTFLDQYSQVSRAVDYIVGQNPSAMGEMLEYTVHGRSLPILSRSGGEKMDLILILYYALLAMSCMYGAYYGLSLVLDVQGDLSARAARVNMAPVHKLPLFISGLGASFTVHAAGLLVFLAYLHWPLGVDFGGRGFLVLVTTLFGSLAGLSLGAFVGVVVKGNENVKVASLTTVTLLGAFLAGMMAPKVKYQIANDMPLLRWINPVNLLADAYYSLYYYQDSYRYLQNMGVLFFLGLIMCAGVYFMIRRRQYVSL